MDDNHEDSKYAANYGLNYGSQNSGKYVDEDDDEVEEEDEQEETNVGDNEINGYTQQNVDDDDDNDDVDDDDDGDDGEDHNVRKRNNNVIQQRHPKKRKLKSLLLSSYEFAPRVPPPTSAPKPSFGGRNTLTDWTEHETFVLLEAWGNRFLQCGRKSLRSEEWQQVAERVSQESKMERTDSQCRNRLDTVKKKYKKEKANLKGGRCVNTKWVYFKKMDMLLSSSNPTNSLNTANGAVDETRGSSGNSDTRGGDCDGDDDDDSDLLPVKKSNPENSFKLLADSINKFSEIYEKIEKSKIEQMIELEKMRMDFHKDLELQKRQILDRAQIEITKVRQGDYEDNDVSAENVSG